MKLEALYAKLASPARRALQALGIGKFENLSGYTKKAISELHGIGPAALKIIGEELTAAGLGFLDEVPGKAAAREDGETPVNEYIRNFPAQVKEKLLEMRAIVTSAAPGAEERISYQMPALYLSGMLVWYAGYAKHIGFYPGASAIAAFKAEISGYKNAKGSVRFPLDRPLPARLITRIVKFRVKENSRKRG